MRQRVSTITLVLGLALCGCVNQPAEPAAPFEITLGIVTLVKSRDVNMAPNTMSCAYYVNARAVGGRAADRATWVSGESVWSFAGGASQTKTWSQTEVLNFFHISGLRSGEIASGHIGDAWMEPYTVTHRFRYSVAEGDEKTATVTLSCQ